MRRMTGPSEIVSRLSTQTTTRGTDAIVSHNSVSAGSFHNLRLNETYQSNDRRENLEVGTTESVERHGSASQTLSDLAAAASNRLMAENAAENAAARQTTRSILAGNSRGLDIMYPDRQDLSGALRSSRDPFFGTTFGPPTTPTASGTNITASAGPSNEWATSEEMEAIRQSQIQQLRERALTAHQIRDFRSPPHLHSDLQGIDGHDEEGSGLRDYSSSFSHSPESSFVEVTGGSGKSAITIYLRI